MIILSVAFGTQFIIHFKQPASSVYVYMFHPVCLAVSECKAVLAQAVLAKVGKTKVCPREVKESTCDQLLSAMLMPAVTN